MGIAVLATNAVAAGWGAVAWLRRDAVDLVLVPPARGAGHRGGAGGARLILLARGENAPDGLHVAYGIAPLVITLFSEGMRSGAAQRELEEVRRPGRRSSTPEQIAIARRVALAEMGVMTVGALLILTLSLRAYQTGGA